MFLTLGKTLKELKSLQNLVLDFRWSEQLTDRAFENISEGLSMLTSLEKISFMFAE